MKSLLIHTTPQQKYLYAVKKYEGNEFPLPFHMHERFELTCIRKGKGTRIIGDSVGQFEDGDIVLLAPYTSHHWQSSLVSQAAVSAISLFFSEEFPTKDFLLLPEFSAISSLLESAKYGIELKGALRKRIASQMTQLPAEYSLDQILRIIDILNDISLSAEYNLLMDRGFSVAKRHDRERINTLVRYIRDHISEKITIEKLADLACMHPGSVTRFFKQSTGFALVEYINLMRIGLACQLLNETNKTVLDIALDCGFHNLSHFNRTFKRLKMMTPGAYRRQFH